MNKVEFKYYIDRWPKPIGDKVTIAAKILTPSGKRFLVVLHSQATIEGLDALEIRRIDEDGNIVPPIEETVMWFKDQHADDYWASDMFGELTGKYQFQIEETMKPEIRYHHQSPEHAAERW